jgi:hypothetical protein
MHLLDFDMLNVKSKPDRFLDQLTNELSKI